MGVKTGDEGLVLRIGRLVGETLLIAKHTSVQCETTVTAFLLHDTLKWMPANSMTRLASLLVMASCSVATGIVSAPFSSSHVDDMCISNNH